MVLTVIRPVELTKDGSREQLLVGRERVAALHEVS
jgi:hypothetical protein